MVANHVLCQLSYTPDSLPIANLRLPIAATPATRPTGNRKSAIGNREGWLRGRDLNPRPLGYEPNELPDCSTPRQSQHVPALPTTERFKTSNRQSEIEKKPLVGLGRVELPTSRLSGVRSNQLSYRPLGLFRAYFSAKKSHTSLLRSVSKRWTRGRAV